MSGRYHGPGYSCRRYSRYPKYFWKRRVVFRRNYEVRRLCSSPGDGYPERSRYPKIEERLGNDQRHVSPFPIREGEFPSRTSRSLLSRFAVEVPVSPDR